MATQQNVRRQEIMGKDEILGSFVGRALDAKLNPIKNGSQFVLGNDKLTEIITSGAFVGEEEKMLAREGGSAEKAALRRRTAASCGFNGKWAHIRGEEATPSDLETIKKLADGGNKKAKRLLSKLAKFAAKSKVSGDDSSDAERQQARQIIDSAVASKTISRDALKKAIWLYAGKTSTEQERTLVGSKMLALLNKKQVKLAS